MKGRTFISMAVVAVLAAGAFGAAMDYNGFGGVMTPADWAELNVTWDPGSYTGVFRWPTTGDRAHVRNGATTALNTFMEVDQFAVGGKAATAGDGGPVIPMPTSRLDLRDGAHLKLVTGDSVDFACGAGYYGIVNQYAGSLLTVNEAAAGDGKTNFRIASSSNDNAGVYNLYGGTIDLDAAAYVNFHVGAKDGAVGVFNQYGGLVDGWSPDKGYIYIGSGSKSDDAAAGGTGTFNRVGGSFIWDNATNSPRCYVGRYSGEGHMNVTGGYTWLGADINLGTTKEGAGYAYGTLSLTGGTLWMRGNIHTGGSDGLGAPIAGSRMTFGQGASVLTGGGIYAWSTDTELELLIDSTSNFDITMQGLVRLTSMDAIVTVDSAFTPTAGMQWTVITAGDTDLTGMGTLTSNYNVPGESWVLLEDVNNDLILQYIPEPATLTLLALGGLALIRRRR